MIPPREHRDRVDRSGARGIGVGLFLAGLATTALSDEGLRFAVPVG